jgi:histidine ammonia-lyase
MLQCAAEKLFSADYWITLSEFHHLLNGEHLFSLDSSLTARLEETENFIAYLLEKKIKVYGLTTGFADLRNKAIDVDESATLSKNIICSHDAGIGKPMQSQVTLGAMILRAHALSKGYSGFSLSSMKTLLGMINERIIPEIPETGSLGASGDLAFLARLGRAMMGENVIVSYRGEKMSASKALLLAGISPMVPKAKEGLALTNGTPFMASMMGIAFSLEEKFLDNLFKLLGLFVNAVSAIDAAFYDCIQAVRYQKGQIEVAKRLKIYLPPTNPNEVQNDYSIRCLPQILGPKLEAIAAQKEAIELELNAITDNPLIFRGSELSSDISPLRTVQFNNMDWAVLSGGNFHGEATSTSADIIAMANAKIAMTMERQLTYLLNPFRNEGKLPIYLVANQEKAGLLSGHMICQYTGNALAHKIFLLSQPASTTNITSGNESEDVVSYGATAAQKLLQQQTHLNELLAIYLIVVAQSYSLARKTKAIKNPDAEEIFQKIINKLPLPQLEDESFEQKYKIAAEILQEGL